MTPERWGAIKQVFQATLDVEPELRGEYLAKACGGDTSLKREVEALIVASGEAGEFIEAPAVDASLRNMVEEPAHQRIGPYELMEVVGEGGMGSVYRAVRDDGEFRMQVAVKLIKRGMDTDLLVRRFRAERQILAHLHHPNIARLLDGGVTDDGRPYFVMEFIEGTPIHVYVNERELHTFDRLRLFLRVCSAVHYAHQNLIVHRDIKASNILVTEDSAPKLLDFGIAKLLDRTAPGAMTEPTVAAAQMLTPDYASPEQIRGHAITTVSDVYSLGVLLYEILTGRRPFQLSGIPAFEMMRMLETTVPARPSAIVRDRKLQDLDNVVFKAMHLDPERRYASAEQLADDIRLYLARRPVSARRDTIGYRFSKFVNRHRTAVFAGGFAGLALIAGGGSTVWQAAVASAERDSARKRYHDVRELANSFLFDIDNALISLPGSMRVRELVVKRVLQQLDTLAKDTESTEAKRDGLLQRELAAAYERMGDVQGRPTASNLGDSAGALASYRKALAILNAIEQGGSRDVELDRARAGALIKISDVLAVTGDHKAALEYDQRALELRKALLAADPHNKQARQDVANAYHEIAGSLSLLGDWKGVLEYRRLAYAILGELYSADANNGGTRRAYALAAKRLGRILVKIGDVPTALGYYDKALALEQLELKQNPTDAPARLSLSFTLMDIGAAHYETTNYRAALENYGKAEAIRRVLSEADPKDARTASAFSTSHLRIGQTLLKTGATSEAIAAFRSALTIRVGLATIDPANAGARGEVGEAYASLGDAHIAVRNCKEATGWYQRALQIFSDLRDKSKLPAAFAGEPDRMRQQIAACAPK
ncbi:MAG: protein kinase domain-containing protein [Bryobacteraceae bacterium]